jgi:photosystem II stability/assembly factor-like uncharacterized protein
MQFSNHYKASKIFLFLTIFIFCQLSFGQKTNKSNQFLSYPSQIYESINYRSIGPFRGGRSSAVTGVKDKPNLFYFGAAGGGVWKTEDGGKTYKNISDGFFGGSIGSVSVAPSDSNVIYVGGGEVTVRGNVSSGYGIWKSVNAGETWKFSGLPDSKHIPRVVIDPNNSDIVYAAVLGNIYKPGNNRGVYKSINGGKSWKKILFSDPQAGAVELIIDPINPRILYAATWRIQRTPYSLSSGGKGSALWKSIDGGNTWDKLSDNKGFAKGTLGIIGITVSPLNSKKVWAIVENKKKGGIYFSNDGGNSWAHINNSRALRQRAWYYSKIYADTQDEDVIYVMNVSYHKSKDGGKTFSKHNAPHGDHHDLWIAPEDSNRLIIADDGGAQISYDAGKTWSTYHNQPTAQFYRVTTDNNFPYRIYVAQQDNSTIRIRHRSDGRFITENDWEQTAGGESAHIAVDPLNDDIVYGGSYGGFLTRVNHGNNSVRGINVWPNNPMGHGAEGMKYRFQWNFPIIFSKHDPKKLYTFSNQVHLSINEGQKWEVISPDLTTNDPKLLKSSGGPITQDNTSVEYYCTIFAANESPLKEGVLWVGSDDGLIHLTKNGGKNWTNVTPLDMPKWMMINSVEPSPFDEGTCYIAGTLYKKGDFRPYLYKTNDYGKNWIEITNGINPSHFTRVVRADPNRKGLLYAGTETGMYISFDDGFSWKSFQLNLPIVPITDLVVKENSLILATQGRSLWMLDDLTVLHQLNMEMYKSEIVLFKPKDSYRMKGSGGKKSLKEGTNLPNGVVLNFNLKNYDKINDTIQIHFSDSKGDLIKSFSSHSDENILAVTSKEKDAVEEVAAKFTVISPLKVNKGSNQFVWDTRYNGAEILKGMIFWSASLTGAKAVPGEYTVTLQKNNLKESKQFRIISDPRSEGSISDMQSQFDFVNTINNIIDKAHKTIKSIRSINNKLKDFEENHSNNDSTIKLMEFSKNLRKSFSRIEKNLYQTKNKSNQDPLNFPIKLTNKLGHLNRLVKMNDFPPTDQDLEVKNELSNLIQIELNEYENLVTEDLQKFNKEFSELAIDYLTLKE